MSKSFKKKIKQKTREQHIEGIVVEIEKDFQVSNFQVTVQKKKKNDKIVQKHIKLLNLTKEQYQKLFEENKLLKEIINSIEKEKNVEEFARKGQHKIETKSEEEEEQEKEGETENEPEDQGGQAKKSKNNCSQKNL